MPIGQAANYLSVGQIYLLDNPLLREPLRPEHVKPRLLGHFGTVPGLNLVYVSPPPRHPAAGPQRDVRHRAGPRRAWPGANAYLEGTYSEVYPSITQDEEGLRRLFRQFSSLAGSPATSRPRLPGRSMKAASSGTRSRTPIGRRSTTPMGSVKLTV
jgi:xylulose-5-phosphate/fructose-6-phosphate phosphoketolase